MLAGKLTASLKPHCVLRTWGQQPSMLPSSRRSHTTKTTYNSSIHLYLSPLFSFPCFHFVQGLTVPWSAGSNKSRERSFVHDTVACWKTVASPTARGKDCQMHYARTARRHHQLQAPHGGLGSQKVVAHAVAADGQGWKALMAGSKALQRSILNANQCSGLQHACNSKALVPWHVICWCRSAATGSWCTVLCLRGGSQRKQPFVLYQIMQLATSATKVKTGTSQQLPAPCSTCVITVQAEAGCVHVNA